MYVFKKQNRKGLIIGAIVGFVSLPIFFALTVYGAIEGIDNIIPQTMGALYVAFGSILVPLGLVLAAIGGVIGATIDEFYLPGV